MRRGLWGGGVGKVSAEMKLNTAIKKANTGDDHYLNSEYRNECQTSRSSIA